MANFIAERFTRTRLQSETNAANNHNSIEMPATFNYVESNDSTKSVESGVS
jgi:hypothetical protein